MYLKWWEMDLERSKQWEQRSWDYEFDPRYVRSPAPTPEFEAEPELAPHRGEINLSLARVDIGDDF